VAGAEPALPCGRLASPSAGEAPSVRRQNCREYVRNTCHPFLEKERLGALDGPLALAYDALLTVARLCFHTP
jgi:hypothetical protein